MLPHIMTRLLNTVILVAAYFSVVTADAQNCWWTGCQPIGTPHKCPAATSVTQSQSNQCKAGLVDVECCRQQVQYATKTGQITVPRPLPALPKGPYGLNQAGSGSGCWWTGCQPTGTPHKCPAATFVTQLETNQCKAGWVNAGCCLQQRGHHTSKPGYVTVPVQPVLPTVPQRPNQSGSGNGCWWTGCQPNGTPHKCPAATYVTHFQTSECKAGWVNVECCLQQRVEYYTTKRPTPLVPVIVTPTAFPDYGIGPNQPSQDEK